MLKTSKEMKTLLISQGYKFVTPYELGIMLDEIGYKIQKGMNCIGISRYMTGEMAGISFKENNLYIVEKDTGISFAHVNARKDANFKKLQELRQNTFSISRGNIIGF